MTITDEMVGRVSTANLDQLIEALPGSVDTAMQQAVPDLYTPELAQQMAEDIASRLREKYAEARG